MGTITTANGKQIIKMLEAEGWVLARVKGSHHPFRHSDGDVPKGTLNSIRKQAGWK
ncbi:type II toxin-antitoxin system HicA family toxin [Verminephrobacter aporrectodeae]|uniref:type II toxin-antitoxin system HicA family toxin n=1 Tax=Verminephrobacter aporrectodeae TaxID=1110389 RepID=UPI0004119916|nr:type II toxin-antitoxin system HicA family toxin [Verminephrobacter aporrectodeae]